ncbi:MAG: hypothetical protein PWP23_2352 [Candidatus Sumerlaeota bacterium]|nr:hypothetical protein [Candidatus Sumerlaeota bacterium]
MPTHQLFPSLCRGAGYFSGALILALGLGASEAAADSLGTHAVQAAPFTSLDAVYVPFGNTVLYHSSKAYDLDPSTGLTENTRPDLWAPRAAEDPDGAKWSFKGFAMPPVAMDRVFAYYEYTPPGYTSATGFPLFDQARDSESGAVAPPVNYVEFQGGAPGAVSSSLGASADGRTLALVSSPRPLSSDTEYALRAAFRNEAGSYDVVHRESSAYRSISTQPNDVAVLAEGQVIAVVVPTTSGSYQDRFSDLVIYRRNGSVLQHVQTLYVSPDPTDILVDYEDDTTLLVPGPFSGDLNVFQWLPEAGMLSLAASISDPRLISSAGYDMTADGKLVASAFNNRIRLWAWDRTTLTLTLVDEQVYTDVTAPLVDLRFSRDGTLLYGIAKEDYGTNWLIAFRVQRDATRSDVTKALLEGGGSPALDANADGVLDAADAITAEQ